MTQYVFGSKELCKWLDKLGFTENKQKGSSHLKYSAPKNLEIPKGIRPFIIVILGRKKYDPHTCSSYIRQIAALGISKEKIIKLLK